MTGVLLTLGVSLLVTASPSAAIVVSAQDPSGGCTFTESLPRALGELLPGIGMETSAGPESTWIELTVTGIRAGWWLVLETSEGYRLAHRVLAYEPLDCGAAVEAMALIVERALRDIGWEPYADLPRLAMAAPAAPGYRVLVRASPRWAWDRAPRATGGGVLSAAIRDGALLLGLDLGFLGMARAPLLAAEERVGRYLVWSGIVRAAAGACAEMAVLQGCTSAALGAEAFFGETGGDAVVNRRVRSFVRPVAAGALRVAWQPLAVPVRLGVEAELQRRLWLGTFVVEGATSSYRPRAWVPMAGAFVEVQIP